MILDHRHLTHTTLFFSAGILIAAMAISSMRDTRWSPAQANQAVIETVSHELAGLSRSVRHEVMPTLLGQAEYWGSPVTPTAAADHAGKQTAVLGSEGTPAMTSPGTGGIDTNRRHSKRVTRLTGAMDDQLTRIIKESIFYDPRVDGSQINIAVEYGVIVLSGIVNDAHQKEAAEQDVRNVRGVENVRNDIQVRQQDIAMIDATTYIR